MNLFVLAHLAAGFVTNGSCLRDKQKTCKTGLLVRSNFPTVFLLWSCLLVHDTMIDNSKAELPFLIFQILHYCHCGEWQKVRRHALCNKLKTIFVHNDDYFVLRNVFYIVWLWLRVTSLHAFLICIVIIGESFSYLAC